MRGGGEGRRPLCFRRFYIVLYPKQLGGQALNQDKSGPTFTRSRRVVPGPPRAVLRSVLVDEPGPASEAEDASAAAAVLGQRALSESWASAADPTAEDTERALRWAGAVERTRAYLSARERVERGPDAEVRRLVEAAKRIRRMARDERSQVAEMEARLLGEDAREPMRSARVARAVAVSMVKAKRCGECQRVFEEEGREGFFLAAMRCNSRACIDCLRRRMRRTFDRWALLFAVTLLVGYRASFVTIGSVRAVESGADVRGYLRRLGTVLRAMREGDKGAGIEPRTWVAGLRALEVVPRQAGGFGHAHLLVVCRSWWPYGLSLAKLREAAAKGGTWPDDPVKLGAALRDTGVVRPVDLGFRHILRRAGCGEVFDDEPVTSAGEMGAATSYMKKIERYMGKIESDAPGGAEELGRMTWGGREDIQAAMRGVRLVDVFGDARGALGGPDRMTRSGPDGPCGPLRSIGVYDPADPETWHLLPSEGAIEAGPETSIDRRTFYVGPVLERWAEWADVDALRAFLLGARPGLLPSPPGLLEPL